jgi:transposase
VPVPYPTEFRRDVIAVARQGDRSRAEVARSFGISESCLNRWMKIADRQDGVVQDGGGDASLSAPVRGAGGGDLEAENRELRRRTKQLEQENEILRRATAYFARDTLPK